LSIKAITHIWGLRQDRTIDREFQSIDGS
jgi:hypothetical protein